MAKITFANANAHGVYHSMAEGMWEVARDDSDQSNAEQAARLAAFDALFDATPYVDGATYPLSFDLPAAVRSLARDVLGNCLDNATDDESEDEREEDRDYIFPDEVTITEGGESSLQGTVGCAEAIAAAIDALETAHCVEGLPDELAPVVRTLEAILAQRGCEDNSVGPRDGLLTSVMDTVIFG